MFSFLLMRMECGGIEPQSFRPPFCTWLRYHLSIYHGGYPDATITPLNNYTISYFLEVVKGFYDYFFDGFRGCAFSGRPHLLPLPLTIIILPQTTENVNNFFKKIFVKFLTGARAKRRSLPFMPFRIIFCILS